MSENLVDAHTFSLDWQGNIYTIATITQHMSHTTKLIVATLNRKVFCLELSMSHCARPCGCVVVPQTQELQFTYIPSGAEIISIDAFNRSKSGDDFVIGVTIIKSAESGSPGQYLNIYSDWDSVMDCRQFQLENLAQSCFSLPLEFTPYQLTHCEADQLTVWLLGGSDRRVHIYSEDKAKHMYQEVEAGDLLPEFDTTFPSVPLWTDTATHKGTRITATGCECGLLVVTSIKIGFPGTICTWHKEFDGPLTCTLLFTVTPPTLVPPSCMSIPPTHTPPAELPTPLNLCVAHSLGPTHVFHDLLSNGLNCSSQLPHSNTQDMATTLCVADIDLTGEHRLVVGTYGQELLVYRQLDNAEWELEWSRSLPAPVLGVRWEDMTGDGLRELVVVTARGVQVLQSQLDFVKEVTLNRLRKLVGIKTEENNIEC